MLRRFADYLLRSRLHAVMAAFVLAFIPLIGTVSILIAGLVTLRKGAVEGALILVVSLVPLLLSYMMTPTNHEVAMIMMVTAIIVASNILTWLLAVILKRYANWSITLEAAAIIGIIIVLIAHGVFPDVQEVWAKKLYSYISHTSFFSDATQNVTQEEAEAVWIDIIKKYVIGLATVSILFNALLQLLVARWWQALAFNPGGLQKELHQIRLHRVSGFLFLIAWGFSYSGNGVVLDIMPSFYLIFSVAGLSVIHAVAAKIMNDKAWISLLFIYAGVILLFPLSIIFIAALALVDTGMDFRKRIQKSKG